MKGGARSPARVLASRRTPRPPGSAHRGKGGDAVDRGPVTGCARATLPAPQSPRPTPRQAPGNVRQPSPVRRRGRAGREEGGPAESGTRARGQLGARSRPPPFSHDAAPCRWPPCRPRPAPPPHATDPGIGGGHIARAWGGAGRGHWPSPTDAKKKKTLDPHHASYACPSPLLLPLASGRAADSPDAPVATARAARTKAAKRIVGGVCGCGWEGGRLGGDEREREGHWVSVEVACAFVCVGARRGGAG